MEANESRAIRNLLVRAERGLNRLFLYIRRLWTNITWGKQSNVSIKAVLSTSFGGAVELGERCEISQGAMLMTYGGKITLGNDCSVNPYCVLYGHGGLRIGHGVRIAAQCVIIPANHEFSDSDRFIFQQPLDAKGIEIDDDVWIGTGAKVLDGVRIARGCVIGAGSVVTRSTEPDGVYAGVPARRIRDRRRSDESA